MLPRVLIANALLLGCALTGSRIHAAQNDGLALRFAQHEPVTVTVAGLVRDKAAGNPIPNALVRAHIVVWEYQGPELFERCPYQEAITDAEGRYQFSFVTPLTTSGPMKGKDGLCVYASAPGYESLPQYARPEVTSKNTNFTNFNFELNAGKSIRGVVLNPAGQPVSGAVVRVQNSMNNDWNFFGSLGRTITGEDGAFQLWIGSAASAKPWLCILKPGSGSLFVWDLLAREDLGSLTLNAGGSLLGQVLEASGKPVPGCEVSARLWPCDLVGKTLTDQAGNYQLSGIPGDASIMDFYKKKNGRSDPAQGRVEVFARPNPSMNLRDAPQCKIAAKAGQTVTGPALVVGGEAGVSGSLLPSKTALSLGGLLVRLDDKWANMVEADVNGHFQFPYVSAGKHTLTAYLPFNLRYDRGIGKTQVEVQSASSLKDVQIQLADLAELHVQYLDAKGNPLSGISAAATWSKNGDGAWTEGTLSDKEGWAVLYLYPDSVQYIRGFEPSRKLTAETIKEVTPQPGQVLEPLQLVMVPTATLSGRLVDSQGQALAGKLVLGALNLADGITFAHTFKTDTDGRFQLAAVSPGIMRLSFEIEGTVFADPLGKAIETRPGEAKELGNMVLKDGLNKAKVIQGNQAHALEQPQEITQAAQELFNKIRTADYNYFLKKNSDWRRFPIVGYYQTYQWLDELVKWMSKTFKANPITNIELGQVFANPKKFNGQGNLPTVPYKLTLKDGSVLQGNLPFEYNFDGGKGHWHGIEGLDWHLQNLPAK